MFSPPSSGMWLADAVTAGAFCMNQSRNPDMFSADKLSSELTVTRSSPPGGTFSDCPSLVFLTESDEVTKTNRRPFSSASVIASISAIAFGARPWSGRLITGPILREVEFKERVAAVIVTKEKPGVGERNHSRGVVCAFAVHLFKGNGRDCL